MNIDIESIFKATAQSTRTFLIANGQGCYVPAYQRPYSWGAENIDRLFEEPLNGLRLLQKRENTISFLGTVIAVHDTKHQTVQPIFKSEMPQRVMTIIDGQQRISTFLLINVALHNIFNILSQKAIQEDGNHFCWIKDETKKLIADLQDTFLIDMRLGDEEYQYYPRLIRSYDDVWSKKRTQAKYKSPICRLIWEYHLHLRTPDKNKKYIYNPKDESGSPLPFKAASEAFKHIWKKLHDVTGAKSDEFDFPDISEIALSDTFVQAMWGYELPEPVIGYILNGSDDKHYSLFSQLFRLVILSKYLGNRMAFTVVTAENEDDAFDMFEALNTTGEPLTAFETFKPKVIEAEGVVHYENSDSRKYMKKIEDYLGVYHKADEKQKVTSDMLIPFALAETGEKLQKKLVDQRKYLRDQFNNQIETIEEKRNFIKRLSNLSQFMQAIWNKSDSGLGDIAVSSGLDEETATCLLFLRDLKHNITVAPLARFYDRYITEVETKNATKFEGELASAIKATVAFSVIWRAAMGGTAGIDNKYRSILSETTDGKYSPLAARPKTGVPCPVSLSNYKKSLLYYLKEEGFSTRDDWVKKVAKAPIYKQRTLARFLLFAASHNSLPDNESPGLIKVGRPGLIKMFSIPSWIDRDYLTVEHIAPQTKGGNWSAEIYEDTETVHLLGNLTLLPSKENSLVSNRDWTHKRAIYRILSSEDEEAFEQNLGDCKSIGLAFGEKSTVILKKSNYLPLCRSLGQKDTDWDLGFIKQRSERLAGLAWDRLHEWLK